jgi:hypothetical protein
MRTVIGLDMEVPRCVEIAVPGMEIEFRHVPHFWRLMALLVVVPVITMRGIMPHDGILRRGSMVHVRRPMVFMPDGRLGRVLMNSRSMLRVRRAMVFMHGRRLGRVLMDGRPMLLRGGTGMVLLMLVLVMTVRIIRRGHGRYCGGEAQRGYRRNNDRFHHVFLSK